MVQKKQMTADFEQLTYNGEMLKDSWKAQRELFQKLKTSKTPQYGMVSFIDWFLMFDWYSTKLFAGSSMWRLLMSKPDPNGKLNYQQTLTISWNYKTLMYILEYSDWDIIDHKEIGRASCRERV